MKFPRSVFLEFVWALITTFLALASCEVARAQVSAGPFLMEIKPGPVIYVDGPTGVINDYRIEFSDNLQGPSPWKCLTNFWILNDSPYAAADPAFGSVQQRYYRLRIGSGLIGMPQSRTVASGETATFKAVVIPPYSEASYQWRRGGTNLID